MSLANFGRIAAVACALPLLLFVGPAAGKDGDSWKVEGKLIGKVDKETGKVKKAKDVSGIACTTQKDFPRSCLVIDDNLQDAQFVTVEDGKVVVGVPIKLIDDKFKGEAIELDGEGVAFANGFYYVIGSHGHPRDKDKKLKPKEIEARIKASSQIGRFRAEQGAGAKPQLTANLRKFIAADEILARFMDRRLEKNGLTIEGVAVKDATLFAGFRGPVFKGRGAAVMSVPLDALFAGSAAKAKVFWLKLGPGRGVRDIVAFEGGLLILAGPAANGPGTYAIYPWDGVSKKVGKPVELTQFDPERKPEGLLPLDRNGTQVRVLILFDSDEEGTPTPVEMTMPAL